MKAGRIVYRGFVGLAGIGLLAMPACQPQAADLEPATGINSLMAQQIPVLEGPRQLCETHVTLASLAVVDEATLAAARAEAGLRISEEDYRNFGIAPGVVGSDTTGVPQGILVFRSPQFHDCQDLLRPGQDVLYSTRAGIRATYWAGVTRDADFTPGVLWQLGQVGWLAGEVYPILRLDQPDFCLYAGRETNTDWTAAALPCATGTQVSLSTVPPNRILQVTRLEYPGKNFAFEAYPPAARWEYDNANNAQAYGVKCGAGWCVIGGADSNRAPQVDMAVYPPQGSPPDLPQYVIHGWRDEQYLADITDSDPLYGRASTLWAALVPDPTFASIPEQDLETGRYRIGWAEVRGPAPKYGAKYGFRTAGRYDIMLVNLDSIYVVNRQGNIVAKRDVQHNNLGAQVIYAMRWAWSQRDEEQWLPCPLGCCETQW